MENRIRDYLEDLFADAPQTKKVYELKEEMFQNLIEKYRDLLAVECRKRLHITLQWQESGISMI